MDILRKIDSVLSDNMFEDAFAQLGIGKPGIEDVSEWMDDVDDFEDDPEVNRVDWARREREIARYDGGARPDVRFNSFNGEVHLPPIEWYESDQANPFDDYQRRRVPLSDVGRRVVYHHAVGAQGAIPSNIIERILHGHFAAPGRPEYERHVAELVGRLQMAFAECPAFNEIIGAVEIVATNYMKMITLEHMPMVPLTVHINHENITLKHPMHFKKIIDTGITMGDFCTVLQFVQDTCLAHATSYEHIVEEITNIADILEDNVPTTS